MGASFWTETSCFHLYPMGLVPSSSPPSHCCAPSQMKIMDAPPQSDHMWQLAQQSQLRPFFSPCFGCFSPSSMLFFTLVCCFI